MQWRARTQGRTHSRHRPRASGGYHVGAQPGPSFRGAGTLLCCILMMNVDELLPVYSMTPEMTSITQSLSTCTTGSLILPDGLLDDPLTGQRSSGGSTDYNESVEVRKRGRSCMRCL